MYLKTLGGLSLEGHDFKQSRPLLLLAYLCVEGGQDRRRLAELFWPSSKNALSNLTTVLSRLNKLDDSLVQVDGQQLSSPLSCDTTDLLAAFAENDYLRVITLHKARFLESFYLKDMGEELEEWLYATRELLATKVRLARLTRAEQKASQGLFEEAAREAEQAYLQAGASEPSEADLERIYNLLIAGESGLAQEVNKEALSYGLLLSQSTQECRQQFTGSCLEFSTPVAVESSVRPKKHNLPKQPSSFVGRVQELKDLKEQLSKGEAQLITLLASGGMGKTRLSLKVAEEFLQTELFSDGVFFVPLAPVNSHELVVQSIVEALDFTLTGTLAPEEQVINQIENLDALIVLDNFEHVLESTEFISHILKVSDKLKLLVTSRERLHIPEEWVYDLWGLSKDESSSVDKPFIDALKLFEQRAKQVKASFDLNADYDHILEICSLVEGMPLGIELAASWTNTISVKDIALEIRESSSFLEVNSRVFAERHRSLMNVMDSSWQRLSEKEQTVFKRLSLFRGGFDYTAAKQVAEASATDLASLTNKALIRLNDKRYEIHELLRQFSYEKLAEDSAQLEASEQKHAVYYADFVLDQEIVLRGSQQLEALSRVNTDLDNILIAWDWAVKAEDASVINKIIPGLHQYLEMQGQAHFGITLLSTILPLYRQWVARSPSDELKVGLIILLIRLVWFGFRITKFDDKIAERYEEIEEGLDLLEAHNPSSFLIAMAGLLHYHAIVLGNMNKATTLFDKAQVFARSTNDYYHLGGVLMAWAQALNNHGNYQESQIYAQESVEVYEKIGEQRYKAFSLNTLGRTCIALGNYSEAKAYFHHSQSIRELFNDKAGILINQIDLGRIEIKLGNFDNAASYLQQSLALGKQLKSADSVWCEEALGSLALHQNKLEEAKGWFQQSLAGYKKMHHNRRTLLCLNYLAILHLRSKEIKKAKEFIQESAALRKEGDFLIEEALSLVCLGHLAYQEHNDQAKAKIYYKQALELAQQMLAAPVALDILVAWSSLEEAEQATELLSLVKHDERSEFATKEKASQRLNDLRGSEGFDTAVEQGKKLELWSVVSNFL